MSISYHVEVHVLVHDHGHVHVYLPCPCPSPFTISLFHVHPQSMPLSIPLFHVHPQSMPMSISLLPFHPWNHGFTKGPSYGSQCAIPIHDGSMRGSNPVVGRNKNGVAWTIQIHPYMKCPHKELECYNLDLQLEQPSRIHVTNASKTSMDHFELMHQRAMQKWEETDTTFKLSLFHKDDGQVKLHQGQEQSLPRNQ
eukprot:scaffold810_cov355-Pavlova_lutheri.AAC.38